MSSAEHLVLTTVVDVRDWRADSAAVMERLRTAFRERARARRAVVSGELHERAEVLECEQRVRLTVSADATTSA